MNQLGGYFFLSLWSNFISGFMSFYILKKKNSRYSSLYVEIYKNLSNNRIDVKQKKLILKINHVLNNTIS